MEHIIDHSSLIAALGGGAEVSRALTAKGQEVLDVSVRAWNSRNRIPAEYWEAIIDIATDRKIDISADWLMRKTPARKRPALVPDEATQVAQA